MTRSQLPKRNFTPLSEAIQVFPVAGNNSIFTATTAWDWCGAWYVPFLSFSPSSTLPSRPTQQATQIVLKISRAAHGGYLLALIHSTAKAYSLLTSPSNPHPHVLTSHIQFLSPVLSSTPIRLTVRPLKLSSRVSILQIELQTSSPSAAKYLGPESLSYKTHTLGIITSGNLLTETGLSFPTRECVPKSEIPDRETECEELIHPSFFSDVAPCILKFTGRVIKGSYSVDMRLSDRFGRCTKDIWYAREDGEDWDLESLGVLCDFVS